MAELIWARLSNGLWWPAEVMSLDWANRFGTVEDPFAQPDLVSARLLGCGKSFLLYSNGMNWETSEVMLNQKYQVVAINNSQYQMYIAALEEASRLFPADQTVASFGESQSRHSECNLASNSHACDNSHCKSVECCDILPKTLKRSNALKWDDYFMAIAFLSAMRSKDPSTQVGACIVNEDMRIVGIGYNGFPRGCSDDVLPWDRKAASELDTKYPYVCHAEVNAILNKNSAEAKNCSMYVALFPCNECAKIIIQSGIKSIVYMSDKYKDTTSMKASRRMLEMAQVRIRQFLPSDQSILISFDKIG